MTRWIVGGMESERGGRRQQGGRNLAYMKDRGKRREREWKNGTNKRYRWIGKRKQLARHNWRTKH